MKKSILFLLFVLFVSPVFSQVKPAQLDTPLAPAKGEIGELGMNFWSGPYGFIWGFRGRYSNFGLSFDFSGMKESVALPTDQLDYDPPHSDYSIVDFDQARYGITFDLFLDLFSTTSLMGSIGISDHPIQHIPQSNVTGWYYKTSSVGHNTGLLLGYGVTHSFGHLSLGIVYKTIFGTTGTICYRW